ncbi:MAG: hypothetical protein ABII00_14465 [Elusimicrobiota bacterium]
MRRLKPPHRELLIRGGIVLGVLGLVGSTVRDAARTRSFDYFRENIVPILETTCSAKDAEGNYVCHGGDRPVADVEKSGGGQFTHADVNMRSYTCEAACHRASGRKKFSFALDADGKISTHRQVMLAYQKAAMLAAYSRKSFAKLLRMPLGALAGGFGQMHVGGEIYESVNDPEYRQLAEWVRLENQAIKPMGGDVGEAQRFFGENVLPVYARNGCLNPSCHVFNHSSFIPDRGMPTDDLTMELAKRFSPEQVSFNRMTSLGLIQGTVHLTGDVEQSRVLRKNIPIGNGGVLHRGGNDQFFSGPDDPDYKTIKKWLTLEREEAVSKLKIDGEPVDPSLVGKVRGVVFVRTKTGNHRRYLDIGKYLPGGDLYLLKLKEGETLETATGEPVNLTARFHPKGEADVREPDVRYDGRGVAFSMRMGEQDNLNVYEILLDEDLDYVEGSFRRLTYAPKQVNGMKVHFTDPTYVPDPTDEHAAGGGYNLEKADLVFVSNLAGGVVPSVKRGTVGEADGGTEDTIVDFDRPEADGTFIGRHVYIVDGANEGDWRKIVGFKNELFNHKGKSSLMVDRPFAEPIDDSTVYVIEGDAGSQPGFLPSYSVYGMKIPAPGEEKRIYDATISRITHGVAQELDLSVRTTGEVFYAGQRAFLDKYGRPIFHVGSCRRHLDTRFSFPTHHGNRSQVLVYADNNEMPTGIDIHVGLDPDNLWEGGNLSVSDHQFGPGLEARNPHDYATGYFDEAGVPRARPKITNVRYDFENGKQPSHPRFVFKKNSLFPLRGPTAVSRTGYSPGGIFRDSIPLPDGAILVSHSPAPIDHLDPKADPDFDLYILRGDPGLQPPGGKGFPKIAKARLGAASAAGMSDIQAYPIYVRMKPKINAANRPKEEHLIRYPGTPDDDDRPAKYLERNFLLIDAIMDDPSPVGKHAAFDTDPVTGETVRDIDKVRYVRMVEVLPTPPALAAPVDPSKTANGDPTSTLICNGIHLRKRIVGEAPVEEDGSIFVRLPSKVPMIIQTLNKDKMALRQEARHYFFAPNETFTISPAPSETFQTCGACMGAMSGKPDRLFGPVNLFSGQGKVKAIAKAKGDPPAYGLKVEDREGIDFVRDIQPVLDRRCAACHNGKTPPKGLRLTSGKTAYYNEAYESLMQLEDPESRWYGHKKYVNERAALAIESYLIEKIFGKELRAPRKLTGDTPHPSGGLLAGSGFTGGSLSEEERMMLVRWIDLGAPFLGAGGAGK